MVSFKFKNNQIEIKDIKGVIFDKDGTLTNSNIFWAEIIKRRSIEIIKSKKIDKIIYHTCAKLWDLIWKVIYYCLKDLLH